MIAYNLDYDIYITSNQSSVKFKLSYGAVTHNLLSNKQYMQYIKYASITVKVYFMWGAYVLWFGFENFGSLEKVV